MAATDKDIYQKEQALRYCVSHGLIPFLEVNVSNVRELAAKPTFLTDIDAMGISFVRSGVRRTMFDCKTAKVSPISRAFWAAGVAKYIEADEAFVILQKSAIEAHRLSAKSLNVHLFDEVLFENYSLASTNGQLDKDSYSATVSRWLKLHGLYKSNPVFEGIDNFFRHSIPLENDFSKLFRGVISYLRQIRGELDPNKPAHNAIFCHAVFSGVYALTPIVNDFFDLFDPKQSKETFDSFLRMYMWGGSESYHLRRRLKEVMATVNEHVSPEVELHNWDGFLEMFRMFLDSPNDLSLCSLPMLDVTLRYTDNEEALADSLLSNRLKRSNRIRQFIFKMSGYLIGAAGLPKDFDTNLRNTINFLMSPKS